MCQVVSILVNGLMVSMLLNTLKAFKVNKLFPFCSRIFSEFEHPHWKALANILGELCIITRRGITQESHGLEATASVAPGPPGLGAPSKVS